MFSTEELALLKIFCDVKEEWVLRPDINNERNYICSECGYSSSEFRDSAWFMINFGNTTPHAKCIQKEWSKWIAGVQTFLSIAKVETTAKEHSTSEYSPDGVIRSFGEIIQSLKEEIQSLRSDLTSKSKQIDNYVSNSEKMESEIHRLNSLVILLSGKRSPETEDDFLAIANQDIHFSGGPNGEKS